MYSDILWVVTVDRKPEIDHYSIIYGLNDSHWCPSETTPTSINMRHWVMVLGLCVCLSVTMLAATYLVCMSKVRHIRVTCGLC